MKDTEIAKRFDLKFKFLSLIEMIKLLSRLVNRGRQTFSSDYWAVHFGFIDKQRFFSQKWTWFSRQVKSVLELHSKKGNLCISFSDWSCTCSQNRAGSESVQVRHWKQRHGLLQFLPASFVNAAQSSTALVLDGKRKYRWMRRRKYSSTERSPRCIQYCNGLESSIAGQLSSKVLQRFLVSSICIELFVQ